MHLFVFGPSMKWEYMDVTLRQFFELYIVMVSLAHFKYRNPASRIVFHRNKISEIKLNVFIHCSALSYD